MSINAVTHDPYAYLDRALPNDRVALYVPKERLDENGNKVTDEDSFGDDGFGFDDFLDIINPLQHIPGISSLYREITGDEISPGARSIGGTIYGGAIGLAVSLVNSAVEEATGKDVGEHVISLFSNEEDEAAPDEMIASTAPPAIEESSDAAVAAARTSPVAAAPVAAAPVVSAPLEAPIAPAQDIPEMPVSEKLPLASPIGLEWKGEKPALLQQLENAKTQNLSEEQLHAVFRSFNTAPSALEIPPVDAKAASAAYQKAASATEQLVRPDNLTNWPQERPAP
ncbi:hypothetical protein [uncultured Sneathiella sp.]|uniref:hypothetical protein n=1 Tax=uncultured Sneathiella sp. TaxID=879315 RepID=UPI002594F803|nr:hypothetical protein [uncultured Sneathiella sp.]